MGRSYTPKYRIDVDSLGAKFTAFGWNSKNSGRATDANLAKWVGVMQNSLDAAAKSYVGAHSQIVGARIVRQSDDRVVASWKKS